METKKMTYKEGLDKLNGLVGIVNQYYDDKDVCKIEELEYATMRNKKFWERENERVLDLYIDEKRALQYKHALKKNGALQKGDKGELLFSEEGEIALLKELKELDQKIFKEEIEVRVYKILEDNCKGLKRFHKEELSELGFI
jgi:hypothetical protein